jgi:hypothetical protein
LIYKVSSKNSKTDQKEILEKINEFKDKLEDIKLSTSDSETQKKIDVVETEFDEWAEHFKNNIGEKGLELQSVDIELEKNKIDLSREHRNYYVIFFKILNQIILAYNKNSQTEVVALHNDNVPLNLFSNEASSFKVVIRFNMTNFWWIHLFIQEPLKEKLIPRILLHWRESSKNLSLGFPDLDIGFKSKGKKNSYCQ